MFPKHAKFDLKCSKMRWWLGLRPRSRWGSLWRSLKPPNREGQTLPSWIPTCSYATAGADRLRPPPTSIHHEPTHSKCYNYSPMHHRTRMHTSLKSHSCIMISMNIRYACIVWHCAKPSFSFSNPLSSSSSFSSFSSFSSYALSPPFISPHSIFLILPPPPTTPHRIHPFTSSS